MIHAGTHAQSQSQPYQPHPAAVWGMHTLRDANGAHAADGNTDTYADTYADTDADAGADADMGPGQALPRRPDSPRPNKHSSSSSHFRGFIAVLGLDRIPGLAGPPHGQRQGQRQGDGFGQRQGQLSTIHEERDGADTCRMLGMVRGHVLERRRSPPGHLGPQSSRSGMSKRRRHRKLPLSALWEVVMQDDTPDSSPREELAKDMAVC